jgi:hypothetical protein
VWNSSLTKREMVVVRQDLSEGNTKLLYMAPESLNKTENIEFLRELKVSFYAIDEAHCISEWGHDFRPEYRMLRQAINAIGRRPILALTATATQKVMSDILKTLEIPKASTFMTSFNRANLTYEVEAKTANVERDVVKLLRNYTGRSAIVYCLSRQKVEELAQVLQLNGLSALPYHAGLDANSRIRHQDAFLNEEVDIIVATVAFGMGIDKPDVRLVVHHDMPRSLEGYYQETGRAGRDGGEGRCVTFYAEKDLEAAILREMESFILEIGTGFAFVARQKRMVIDGEDHHLDLLFYHRGLRRLIAIELKLGDFKAAYKGQMELYLAWLNHHERGDGEERPIGLILCAGKKDETIRLLDMEKDGIQVSAYWTEILPKAQLQQKLHEAVIRARARLGPNLPEPNEI